MLCICQKEQIERRGGEGEVGRSDVARVVEHFLQAGEYLWRIRSGLELQDPRPLPPTRNYSKSLLVRLLEINNVRLFLLLFFPYPTSLPPPSDVSCGWALGALRCWMFNITRAIIYAWRAGQRPHNLDQWAELACSTTLRLVPYGVYLVTLYLNASWNTLRSPSFFLCSPPLFIPPSCFPDSTLANFASSSPRTARRINISPERTSRGDLLLISWKSR